MEWVLGGVGDGVVRDGGGGGSRGGGGGMGRAVPHSTSCPVCCDNAKIRNME